MDGVRPSMLPIVRRASFIGGYMTEGHRRPTELPRLVAWSPGHRCGTRCRFFRSKTGDLLDKVRLSEINVLSHMKANV